MIGFGALLERSGGPLWAHKWWSSIEERLSSSAKENIVVKIGMNIVLATEALKRGDWERAEESLVHIITSEFKAVEAVPVGVFDRARLKLAQTKERQGQYVEGAQAWFKVAGQNTLSNDRLLGLKRGLEITVHQRDPLLLKKSTELKPIWKALNLQATDSQDPCVWVGDLVSQWANVSNGGRADLEQMTLLSQHGHACYRNVLSSPAVLVERTKACQVTANWRELIEHGRIYDVNYKVLLEDFGKFSRKLLSTASKGNVVACEVLSGWQSLDEGRLLLRKFESHTLKLRASKKINVAAKRFSAIVQKLSKLFTKAVAKLVELENHSSGIVRYLALSDIGRLYATMGIRIDHLTNRASSALEKEGQSIFHEMVQAQMAELRNQKAVYMRAASSLLEQLGPREKWLRFVTIPPLGRSASDG